MKRRLRVLARLARLLPVLALGAAMAAVIATGERLGLSLSLRHRQRCTAWFMRRLSAALPFNVDVQGHVPLRPMLWVSNHVSWTDIALLGALAPLSFLSKAEVRDWPLAGWLANTAGTLFLRRGNADSHAMGQAMHARFDQACPLLLFPEGTTTDGRSVSPFHGRLLTPAIDRALPLQPVAIQYLRDGERDPVAPYIGDDDLVSHLLRVFAEPCAQVRIQLLPVIPSQGKPRAQLARQAQQAIAHALQDAVTTASPLPHAQPA